MARTAGPLTLAIRRLCDESNGNITHAEARPQLKKLGFDIVPEPPAKSAALTQVLEAADAYKRKPDFKDAKAVETFYRNACAKCGLSVAITRNVLAEITARNLFDAEANNFNVTKHIWSKNRPSPSRKPAATKKTTTLKPAKLTPKYAAEPARRGRPRRTAVAATASNDVLAQVSAMGGLSAVEARIGELNTQIGTAQTEIGRLQGLQTAFAELQKQVAAAA